MINLACEEPKVALEAIVARPGAQDDLLIVEQLLELALTAIEEKTPDVRLADILKLLEFKYRIKPESDAQAQFWQWIERFRCEAAAEAEATGETENP